MNNQKGITKLNMAIKRKLNITAEVTFNHQSNVSEIMTVIHRYTHGHVVYVEKDKLVQVGNVHFHHTHNGWREETERRHEHTRFYIYEEFYD